MFSSFLGSFVFGFTQDLVYGSVTVFPVVVGDRVLDGDRFDRGVELSGVSESSSVPQSQT